MVQSVKRALKLDADHPSLHSCLIRLSRFLTDGRLVDETVSNPAVASVLKNQSSLLFQDKDAEQLNQLHLESHSKSLPHLAQGIIYCMFIYVLLSLFFSLLLFLID